MEKQVTGHFKYLFFCLVSTTIRKIKIQFLINSNNINQ